MAQRFCTECGTPLDGAFCTNCGTPAAPAPVAATPPPVSPPPPPPPLSPAPADLYAEPPTAPLPALPLLPAAAPPTALAAPGRRSRKPLLIGACAAAGLLLVGGTLAGVVLLGGDDEKDQKDPPKPGEVVQPVNSLLGEAGQTWTVTAAEVVDQPDASFFDIAYEGEGESVEPLVVGDTVVMGVSGESESAMVAFDLADGRELWKVELADGWIRCSGDDVGRHLACERSTYDEATEESSSRAEVYDIARGDLVGSMDVTDGYLADVHIHEGRVYTLATDYDYGSGRWADTLTAGSLDQPGNDWSVELGDLVDEDYAEYWDDISVEEGMLRVSVGPWAYDVDPENGSETLVSDEGWDSWSYRVDDAVVVSRYDEVIEDSRSTWTEGDTVLNFTGSAWSDVDGQVRRHGDLAGFGSALYDVTNGQLVTSFPVVEYSGSWLADDTVLIDWYDDYSETTEYEVRDALTGEILWYPMLPAEAVTDDAYVSYDFDNAELAVRDLRSGEQAWSADLTDGLNYDDGEYWGTSAVALADDGMVAATDRMLFGFTDFPERKPRVPASYSSGGASGDAPEDDEEEALGTDYVTKCGSEPVFEPVTAVGDSTGMEVTFTVTAVCSSGQWVDSSAYRIPLLDGDGVTMAEGVYDFSDEPLWVPPTSSGNEASSTVSVPYEVGQFWRYPEEVQDEIDRQTVQVPCVDEDPDPRDESLEPLDPETPDEESPDPSGEIDDVVTADEREANSLAALKRLKRQDAPYVREWVNRWVPQLSSKKDGTRDDGIEYDYTAIYENHLSLSLQYPDVRLVWSGDYPTFELDNFWVSMAGVPSDAYQPVLDWCDDQGIGLGDCAAKRLRLRGGYKGNTKWRPGTFE